VVRAVKESGGGEVRIGRLVAKGLWALLPTAVTLWLLTVLCETLVFQLGQPTGCGLLFLFHLALDVNADRACVWAFGRTCGQLGDSTWVTCLLGTAVLLAVATIFGAVAGRYIGRWFLNRLSVFFRSIPVFNVVFPQAAELVKLVVGDDVHKGLEVVALRYPDTGIYSIGFVTARNLRPLTADEKGPRNVVFVSATPVPVTGFAVTAHDYELIRLPVGPFEMLVLTASGGILVPPALAVGSDDGARLANGNLEGGC
jgi:uncharacterized membrane protein